MKYMNLSWKLEEGRVNPWQSDGNCNKSLLCARVCVLKIVLMELLE